MDRIVPLVLGGLLCMVVYATQQPDTGSLQSEFVANAASYQAADPGCAAPAAPPTPAYERAAGCSQPAAAAPEAESCAAPRQYRAVGCSQPAGVASCSTPDVAYEAEVCEICGKVHTVAANSNVSSNYAVTLASHSGHAGPVRKLLGFERRAARRAGRQANRHVSRSHGAVFSSGWNSYGLRGGGRCAGGVCY
jgi:hypothetical protein